MQEGSRSGDRPSVAEKRRAAGGTIVLSLVSHAGAAHRRERIAEIAQYDLSRDGA
jgi:hypothetical protein